MAEFYKIQIGTIFFTSDGTNSGEPCKVEIPNLSELLEPAGNTERATNGKPKTEFPLNEGRGVAVELKFASVTYAQHTALKTLFASGEPFLFKGTGLAGNFQIGAVPNHAPTPLSFGGDLMTTRIKNLIVRLMTDDLPV